MGKQFHELTAAELDELKSSGATWEQAAKEHPQPEWCEYPDAVSPMGCWSLISGNVTGIDYCAECDCLRSND